MIDVWFLFSLLKPFVDIIAQTYIETLREHPDEKNGNEMSNAWSDNKKVSMNDLKYLLYVNIKGKLS